MWPVGFEASVIVLFYENSCNKVQIDQNTICGAKN